MDLACSGKQLSAEQALKLGAIDVVNDDFESAVQDLALPRPTPVSQLTAAPLEGDWFAEKRTTLKNRARGQMAPLHNLDALQWAMQPYSEGQPKERALHLSLRNSNESRALRHQPFDNR